MKAKLLKEQMGVPAGTELEVLKTGRAWTLKAPSGAEIVVPSCDCEMVPDTEPFSEPKPEPEVDPKDPSLLVNIFGGQPEPDEEELDEGPADPFAVVDGDLDGFDDPEPEAELDGPWADDASELPDDHFSTAPLDDDLDEDLPAPQGDCDGEACESCT